MTFLLRKLLIPGCMLGLAFSVMFGHSYEGQIIGWVGLGLMALLIDQDRQKSYPLKAPS